MSGEIPRRYVSAMERDGVEWFQVIHRGGAASAQTASRESALRAFDALASADERRSPIPVWRDDGTWTEWAR